MIAPALRDELTVLLAAARTVPSEAASKRAAELAPNLDWTAFARLAEGHGVAPLVFSHWKRYGFPAAPPAVMDALRTSSRVNAQSSLVLTGTLLGLLETLRTAGVQAVPFKGPMLGVLAYGDASLRPCVDLDLMVRRGDVWSAVDVFHSSGFQPKLPLPSVDGHEAFLNRNYHIEFLRHAGRTRVELHWNFAQQEYLAGLRPAAMWDRLRTVRLGAVDVLSFSFEDLMVILCVHGAKHAWSQLKWICDVAELLRREAGPDPQPLLQAARATGSERMVTLGISLAGDLLDVRPWPESALDQPQALEPLRLLIRDQLAREESRPIEGFEIQLLSRSWTQRLRLLAQIVQDRLAPNARDQRVLRLPRGMQWMYYTIRPIRLLREYGARPLRYLAGVFRR